MKTVCPGCQVTFRITPEQLKARAGKVRCGQCAAVFNAFDSLLDETGAVSVRTAQVVVSESVATPSPVQPPEGGVTTTLPSGWPSSWSADFSAKGAGTARSSMPQPEPSREPYFGGRQAAAIDTPAPVTADDEPRINEEELFALGKATGLIVPRDSTELPGYSKWNEGAFSASELPAEGVTRWPFTIAAVLLLLALAGQALFHFRSDIAVSAPALRPLLQLFTHAIGADLPLPRRVELVSIEASDLQTDPTRNNLLVLATTLRNRAPYAQAYPSLELSLTDTADTAVVRRVFPPRDYLPANTPDDRPFAANAEVVVRLWIEAREVSAAGYRLYVFYP